MRIAVISRSWPVHERSGVTLVAAEHVRLLDEAGHAVTIVGADPAVLQEALPVQARCWVRARGTGALYAPARVDRARLAQVLRDSAAELVLVEAWQTALTDAAVDVAHDLGLPVVMISHGVSLHAFTSRFLDRLRSWAWTAYRLFSLPARMRRLTALAVLDMTAASPRFYDRDLAVRFGVPVFPLVNAPVHFRAEILARSQRRRQIIVVGYYSPVKNQLAALRVMAGLPQDLEFCFVGPRAGRYYEQCVRIGRKMGLAARIRFLEDRECDLAQEIGSSLAMLCTSTTEVFPLSLLEAMASGTPFVAPPVGAVSAFNAGLLAGSCEAQRGAILRLLGNEEFWQQQADAGLREYRSRYTREHVRSALLSLVAGVTKLADSSLHTRRDGVDFAATREQSSVGPRAS